MSKQMTTITLVGTSGYSNWGAKSREEMIAQYRLIAERQKSEAEKILSAPDDAFHVYRHTGVYRQRNIVTLSTSQSADVKAGG